VRAWPTGNQIQIAVADTGPGIPRENHEWVFERFEQGETGVKRPEGIGVGLALCKEFVEMHGGRIWVESAEGAGSTFNFTLPVRQDHRD
jgi:signal transduction histidine kinase